MFTLTTISHLEAKEGGKKMKWKQLAIGVFAKHNLNSSVAIINPRPTKPFFVTWFTKGGGYPPHEIEIDRPKV